MKKKHIQSCTAAILVCIFATGIICHMRNKQKQQQEYKEEKSEASL